MVYDNNFDGEYARYFVQDLSEPETFTSAPPEYQEMYKKFSQRILWIDDKLVPGAFQMNTAWWFKVPERDPVFLEHCHDDTSEIIGLFGSDMNDPQHHDLRPGGHAPQPHAHPGGQPAHFPLLGRHERTV